MAAVENRLIDQLLKILRENGRLEFSEIRRQVHGFEKKTVNRALYTLRNRGLIAKVQETPPIWGLPRPLSQAAFTPTATGLQNGQSGHNHIHGTGTAIAPVSWCNGMDADTAMKLQSLSQRKFFLVKPRRCRRYQHVVRLDRFKYCRSTALYWGRTQSTR